MKNQFIITVVLLTTFSCRMTQESFNQPVYGSPCDDVVLVESVYSEHYLTLAETLKWAKTKYGNDVSVANIHYDVKSSPFFLFGSKRRSSIFDVVKCK